MVLNVARGNIGRVGILELRGVGGTLDLDTDGFDSVSRTCAWVDEPVTGILSILTFPVDDLVPPPWAQESKAEVGPVTLKKVDAKIHKGNFFTKTLTPTEFRHGLDLMGIKPLGEIKKEIKEEMAES